MTFLKSVKGFVMSMFESIAEAKKARADAVTRRIGR